MLLPTPSQDRIDAVKKCFEKSEWRGLASVSDETKIPMDVAIDVLDFIGGDTVVYPSRPFGSMRGLCHWKPKPEGKTRQSSDEPPNIFDGLD